MKQELKKIETPNYRIKTMLEECSDEKAIILAESIQAHRMAGLPTHHLDEQLEKELTRMKKATRVLFGRFGADNNQNYNAA